MSELANPNWPENFESLDKRNICDYYKYWNNEAILADQDSKRCGLVIIAENFGNDFNISTVIRSSNAFLCKEVIIAGRKKWDRRGAVGMQNYEHVKYVGEIDEAISRNPNNRIVVLDNIPGAKNIYEYSWEKNTTLILGQESIGVSPESIRAAHDVVYIPQFGVVRSLNVGSAASIAMAFYRAQWQ